MNWIAGLPDHQRRSDAIWLFQNWTNVLAEYNGKMGRPTSLTGAAAPRPSVEPFSLYAAQFEAPRAAR